MNDKLLVVPTSGAAEEVTKFPDLPGFSFECMTEEYKDVTCEKSVLPGTGVSVSGAEEALKDEGKTSPGTLVKAPEVMVWADLDS